MKRILSISILLALSLMTFAQEITVRFTGQLNGTAYQQLDSVVVTNTTRGWTETVVYPDTLIVLGSTVNISENEALVVGLGQNVPNPFDCQTRVELTISQNENVRMQLMDVSGKVYAEFNDNLEAGTHNFEISAAKAQTYILNAVAGNRNYSIRMVNVGSGCNNGIRYQGYKGVLETKLVSTKEFHVGDHLQCEGYATHNGERLESSASFILGGNYTRVFDFHYCATTYGVDEHTACDIFMWIDGNAYTESNNTATYTLQNAAGCDSIVTLNLTINHSNTGVDTQTASESYTWIDGITYTESTDTPTYTLQNVAGCDSVVTLHLTICNCGAGVTVTDFDGNQYGTVLIGEQCWMAENLKTTHFADGTSISLGSSSSTSSTTAYRYNPNNDSNNVSTYGYLYNWPAAMHGANSSDTNPSNVQGICPNGWHLPSDAEWTQLTDYVRSQSEYQCDGPAENIAKALASTTGWNSSTTTCAVGNTPSSNNSTGFGALPAGGYYGSYSSFGNYAYFWSATEHSSSYAYDRTLGYKYAYVHRGDGKKYYGRSVRCVRDEDAQETSLLPTVTTTNVSSITVTSAVCGGDVISDGGATVTARGVCWSTSQDPTINNSITTDGTGTGSFTSNLTGLTANTTYYVRAYATNSVGTAYGEQKTFTTQCECGGSYKVTDFDGNQYGTVLIGEQCWMAQNLKTTHFADGTSISLGSSSSTSSTTAYRYNPNNDSNNVSTYGYLYNWPAAMHGANSSDTNPSNVQGICPNGWHLPSDAEWTQLTDYVSSQSEYQCDGTAENIAKALASTTGWSSYPTTCAVGNTPSSNNSTGFGALPAGVYVGSYGNFGYDAYFWSATENGSSDAYFRDLYYGDAYVNRGYYNKYYGRSVRCVRDEDAQETSLLPTVTTTNVSSITVTSAVCGGDVISDGGATVTARGVCWSTSQDPTINNSITTDGTGTGSFTSNLTGLTANTTYYVRAYATNSVGTAYGEQKTFTTQCECGGSYKVTDFDGNQYGTVLIGEQCWMAQNLKTTHFADGTSITLGSSTSSTTAYRYNPNNDSNNVSTYGYLYNWPAAMHGANSSDTNPSNVQGICPNGWHLPSDAEWTQLTDYVSSQSEYQCDGTAENIAKALASTTGWNSSTFTCAVGNTPSSNNSTGFGALPAGDYYNYGSYSGFGRYAFFWSATEDSSSYAHYRSLYFNNSAGLGLGSFNKNYGRSVRCVRD